MATDHKVVKDKILIQIKINKTFKLKEIICNKNHQEKQTKKVGSKIQGLINNTINPKTCKHMTL